ncbi:hypothetical protein [Paenibacillus popilliae]|uniref:Uncharacterized protein n=1 Tax=Paenibacillus popilliae ATCC 14706 TaxID=1212764 RepID=M9M3S3_PAEPP|nr:hypothetical protein [Paenibacillus popilliae]GAC41903.1 hypothetical protein PPOP_1260 [Paenibacillus popilliae ATCC 14706]
MTNVKKQQEAVGDVPEPLFYKWQLLSSTRQQANPDLLESLLIDNKQYTLNEVQKLINDFEKRKV